MSDRLQRPHSRFLPTRIRSACVALPRLLLFAALLAACGASAQTPDASLETPDASLGNRLGMALDADAQRIIAGAPGTVLTGYRAKNPAGTSAIATLDYVGAFAIYRDNVSEWVLEQYVEAPFGDDPSFVTEPGLENIMRFGTAVAIDGDLALVSAPGVRLIRYGDPDPGLTGYKAFFNMGIVYAYEYDAGSGSWNITQMLTSAEEAYEKWMQKERYFGQALALQSDWLAVSQTGDILGAKNGSPPPSFPVRLYEYVSTPGGTTPACASISYAYSLPAPLDPFPTYPCWVESDQFSTSSSITSRTMGTIDPPAVEYDLADGPVTTVGTTFTDATCNTKNNSIIITMDSTAAVKVGMTVTGAGIPAGARVDSVTNETKLKLTAKATARANDVPLTFSAIDLIDIEVDGAIPDPPMTNEAKGGVMGSGDQIYLTGLSGTVAGVVTSQLNNNWWSIISTSGLSSIDKPVVRISIAPHVSTGVASGGGNSGKYNRYQESVRSVDFVPVAFGAALAFDPDADVIAVGAPYENTKTGVVYVYRRDGTGAFVLEATLVASDAAEYDLFGVSISVGPDRVVVGAQLKPCVVEVVGATHADACTADGNGLLATGAVYVFDYDAGSASWSEVEKILPPTDATYQLFGTSLALNGDDLIVGTPGTVLDELYQGSVHHYRDDGIAFEWLQEIEGPRAYYDAVFGARVASRGTDVIAGSPNQDREAGVLPPAGFYTGEVFVYSNYLASSSSGGGAAPVLGPEPGVLSGWVALALLGTLARRRRRAEDGSAHDQGSCRG